MNTDFTTISMSKVPSNYGYIKENQKIFGHSFPAENDMVVRLVDTEKKHTHTWKRKSYFEYKMNKNEPNEDGWVEVGKRRKLVESVHMQPCKFELDNNGYCPHSFDPEHKKYFYHFSKLYNQQEIMRDTDGKPYCKYHLSGNKKCWESHNPFHRQVFSHKY